MSGPRTSQTHPLQIAEVRMSPTHGRIGITFCPGKQDSMASTGAWARDLVTDIEAIAVWGARLVLSLVESLELGQLKVPGLGAEVEHHGMAAPADRRSEERQPAQRWFGVHAWTANWDAAGFQGDNRGVVTSRVLTLDVGGALEFRAMGNPKGKAFGTRVGELDRLYEDTDNPYAVKLVGGMDEAALQAAIQIVTRIPDALIWEAIIGDGGSVALTLRGRGVWRGGCGRWS